jgi:hypothetical protein
MFGSPYWVMLQRASRHWERDVSAAEGRWTDAKTWESKPSISHSEIRAALMAAREYIAYDAGQREADQILAIIDGVLAT